MQHVSEVRISWGLFCRAKALAIILFKWIYYNRRVRTLHIPYSFPIFDTDLILNAYRERKPHTYS